MSLIFVSKFSPASSGLRPLLLRSKPGGSSRELVVCKAGKVGSGFQGQTRGGFWGGSEEGGRQASLRMGKRGSCREQGALASGIAQPHHGPFRSFLGTGTSAHHDFAERSGPSLRCVSPSGLQSLPQRSRW